MPIFTEDQMADILIANTEELLGERLTLVARKHWIGRYELDLLFRDRHGRR
jgi:galactose-1-phosphate uridylyltransferase